MRIKIPFVEFETNKECPCKDQNEYELKLRCMKAKIHSIYIASIAAGIVIWALATGQANSEEFSSWISFASTITSIILSVIAIFMSICKRFPELFSKCTENRLWGIFFVKYMAKAQWVCYNVSVPTALQWR